MEDYPQYVAEHNTELLVFSQNSTNTDWEFRFLLACDQFSHCKKESYKKRKAKRKYLLSQ